MKRHLLILCLGLLSVHPTFAQTTEESCHQDGRNTQFCFKMKSLRSHVLVLELLRDQRKIDFTTINALGENMDSIVNKLMISASPNVHIRKLNQVKNSLTEMRQYATSNNLEAYRSINTYRDSCAECHHPNTQEAPVAEVFPGQVSSTCHIKGHNPIVCDNMHGLKNLMSFFHDTQNANNLEKTPALAVSKMMQGIVNDLRPFAPAIHTAGSDIFADLETNLNRLEKELNSSDPDLTQTVTDLTDTCGRCHSKGR